MVRNADTSLRPGMFARVRLITRDAQDALVVPEQALVPQGDEQFVFRIVDGKAVRTKVEVGQRRDAKVEVLKGVDPGRHRRHRRPAEAARRHAGDARRRAPAKARPTGAAAPRAPATRRAAGQGRQRRRARAAAEVLSAGTTAMQLPEICIKRPVFATVLSLIILLVGLISYTRLSVREYPRIDEPVVSVVDRPTAARPPKWSSRR